MKYSIKIVFDTFERKVACRGYTEAHETVREWFNLKAILLDDSIYYPMRRVEVISIEGVADAG